MFDISWGKLVIIGVVALLVIGPKELPGVLRQLGQAMAKIRRMAAEFQGQFQEAMREAEMADIKKQFDETTSDIKSTFDTTDIKNELEKMIQEPVTSPASGETSAPASDLPAPAQQTAAAEPVALGTAPVAPPAVDISVPMPELPPPPETKDFLDAPAAPAAPEPKAAATPEPKAAATLEPKPVAAPEGGKAA
jgi:sec-independent protein translocase protein TatB